MPTLYIVSTPIGNLEDITLRALRILKEVDLIICEDTRQTKKLLNHYKIPTPTTSYHQHSKLTKVNYIIDKLKQGKNIAMVSDAGTPSISDPGSKLIAQVKDIAQIVPVPGPSALVAAVSVSGLAVDKFLFLGYLPHKKGRQKLYKEIAEAKRTVVFYESKHRIIKTLKELQLWLDIERQIVVCRELTKKFESIYRGNISEVLKKLQSDSTKGEFVVLISS